MIVDASVAAKWLLPEDDSALAESVLKNGALLQAPELLHVEVGNVLWRRVRLGELTAKEARGLVATMARLPVVTTPDAYLAEAAFALAVDLDHPIYDCLYLALALETGEQVITADARFAKAVASHPLHRAKVKSLTELAS